MSIVEKIDNFKSVFHSANFVNIPNKELLEKIQTAITIECTSEEETPLVFEESRSGKICVTTKENVKIEDELVELYNRYQDALGKLPLKDSSLWHTNGLLSSVFQSKVTSLENSLQGLDKKHLVQMKKNNDLYYLGSTEHPFAIFTNPDGTVSGFFGNYKGKISKKETTDFLGEFTSIMDTKDFIPDIGKVEVLVATEKIPTIIPCTNGGIMVVTNNPNLNFTMINEPVYDKVDIASKRLSVLTMKALAENITVRGFLKAVRTAGGIEVKGVWSEEDGFGLVAKFGNLASELETIQPFVSGLDILTTKSTWFPSPLPITGIEEVLEVGIEMAMFFSTLEKDDEGPFSKLCKLLVRMDIIKKNGEDDVKIETDEGALKKIRMLNDALKVSKFTGNKGFYNRVMKGEITTKVSTPPENEESAKALELVKRQLSNPGQSGVFISPLDIDYVDDEHVLPVIRKASDCDYLYNMIFHMKAALQLQLILEI